MEYVQITLNDWVEMKEKIKRELQGVKQSFVRIGYALRQIDDQKLYERDGYKSIAEFAKAEYGLEPSTTSRFMSINREYSIDGYSERLRPEYVELGRSQLEEMLKLPDEDRQMIQPETSREDIRDLKRFNKSEPAVGVADDIRQLVEKFYQDNPDILNAVFSESQLTDTKKMIEIINPGGNRSYKKGLFFLMMYENKIAVKKFGTDPQEMTWEDFIQLTMEIFADAAAGAKTWQRYFGGDEDTEPEAQNRSEEQANQEVAEESQELTEEADAQETDESEESKEEEDNENPAERVPDNDGEPDGEPIEDDTIEEEDGKEFCESTTAEPSTQSAEEKSQKIEIAPAQKTLEILEKEERKTHGYGTRKKYMDTLTEHGAAGYISQAIQGMTAGEREQLDKFSFWEAWMQQEVDEKGREIEVIE